MAERKLPQNLEAEMSVLGCAFLTNYALDKVDEKITEKQKYTWLFTSWAIIVFLSLNLLESLTFFVI